MSDLLDRFGKIPLFQKIVMMILIVVILIGLFYVLVLSPEKSKQETIKNEIKQTQKDMEEKRKMVEDLSTYKREVDKLDQDLKRALKLLPNKSEIPSLLQKFSSLGSKAGLEMVTFEPRPEIMMEFYAEVPIALSLSGTYIEITNFFDAIGKLPRIVNIKDFNFKVDTDKQEELKTSKKLLSATCIATTFRFLPEEEIAAMAAANAAAAAKTAPGAKH